MSRVGASKWIQKINEAEFGRTILAGEKALLDLQSDFEEVFEKSGLKAYELAREAGCSESCIHGVLNGDKYIEFSRMVSCLHALGYSFNFSIQKRFEDD